MSNVPAKIINVGTSPGASREAFVDRERELDRLLTWAADTHTCPLMILTGFGGIGKTMLASVWFDAVARQDASYKTLIWCDVHDLGPTFLQDLTEAVAPREANEPEEAPSSAIWFLYDVQPFVLVLDGFERALFAYDDHKFEIPARDSHALRRVADPRTREFLYELIRAEESKTLITSRLAIADIEEPGGTPAENTARMELGPLTEAGVRELWLQANRPADEVLYQELRELLGGHPLATSFMLSALTPGPVTTMMLDTLLRQTALMLADEILVDAMEMGDLERTVLHVLLQSGEPLTFPELAARLRQTEDFYTPDSLIDRALTTLEDLQIVRWEVERNRLSVHPLARSALMNIYFETSA